jgi:hypothetical protein
MQLAKARAGIALYPPIAKHMPKPGFDGIGGNKLSHCDSPGTFENSGCHIWLE